MSEYEELRERLENEYSEEAVQAFLDCFGDDLSYLESFEDAYCGQYESEIDYVEQYIDECGVLDEMPENLRHYFDYKKFAKDVFIDDMVFSDGFVFYRNW